MAATALVMDRLLSPIGDRLTAEVGERPVAPRAEPVARERIDRLAERADEGALTRDERLEYEARARTVTFVSLLQSRARKFSRDEPRS